MADSLDYQALYKAEKARADGLADSLKLAEVLSNPDEKSFRSLFHDIRRDVGNTLSLAEILNMELTPTANPGIFTLTKEAAECLPLIVECASKVLAMATDYLELTRMERGLYELRPKPFNLMRTIYDAGNAVIQTAEANRSAKTGVKIHYHTVEKYIAEDYLRFCGEELKIRACMSNLIQNAYEAAPEKTDVHVFFNSQREKLTIEISNKGSIPPELRDPEVLFAFGATSGKKNGNGIGTYTARLFARAHGGDVTFQTSDKTNSTIFKIELPKPKALD